jgi:hypothetical protein
VGNNRKSSKTMTKGPKKSGNRVNKHTKQLHKPEKKQKITKPTDKIR